MKKENLLDITEEVIVSGSTLAINMLLPIIGPIINEIADFPSRLSKKRKDRYLEAVIKQLEKTNENLIDKGFIHSDDFIDIIQTVVHKITLRPASSGLSNALPSPRLRVSFLHWLPFFLSPSLIIFIYS